MLAMGLLISLENTDICNEARVSRRAGVHQIFEYIHLVEYYSIYPGAGSFILYLPQSSVQKQEYVPT